MADDNGIPLLKALELGKRHANFSVIPKPYPKGHIPAALDDPNTKKTITRTIDDTEYTYHQVPMTTAESGNFYDLNQAGLVITARKLSE